MLTWNEPKRKLNIKNHGLDFVGCDAIWDHFTVTREDKRQDYGEELLVCFGLFWSSGVRCGCDGLHRTPERASRDIAAKGRKT